MVTMMRSSFTIQDKVHARLPVFTTTSAIGAQLWFLLQMIYFCTLYLWSNWHIQYFLYILPLIFWFVNDLSMIYLITMPLVLPIVGPSFDDGLDDVRQQWLTKGGLVWRHKGKGWLDRICPPIDIPTMQHNGYSGGRGAPCSSTGKWGVVGQVREWCPRFANVAIWQAGVPDPAQP